MDSSSKESSFLSSGDPPGYSSLRPPREIDWITSAQLSLGKDEILLSEVMKALFEDFYANCSSSIDNTEDLVRCFYKLLDDAIRALRKVAVKSAVEGSVLASTISQLVSEQKAYSLLIKLTNSENLIGQLERGRYILWDLLIDDSEFRRISILLEWCEENAFSEPKANAEVCDEYAQLEKGSHIRAETLFLRKKGEKWCDLILLEWCEENAFSEPKANAEVCDEYAQLEKGSHIRAETLFLRKKGEKWCDLDLDGAMHGRLHATDEDAQNRVYNVVYTLVRCGRTNEAITLLNQVGLSALVPSLKFHAMARDASLTPVSNDHPFYRLADSRAFFKRAVDKIISEGQSMSQIERCLWSIVGGLLEPALSLCSRTDDRLWCYLNTAVENRLDAAIAKYHQSASESSGQKSYDLMVASIFDEIATQERSPYYWSYRYLALNDSEAHLTYMRQWLECHVRERHSHFLRYVAHVVLVYMANNQPFLVKLF
ncbi:Nuclear pore complex protein [Toxocara canis]|uniref:Nuclear pore complex protein n=1 Tax=Toxocara canis TaxID=6265 RepID=A0A0B2VDT4_TOXCA|nr:Nuclear pore complex protein [Toxocara canis]